MTETLGEFRTDLGLCANNILTENSFSVDVPSQKLNHLKANVCPSPSISCPSPFFSYDLQITVKFKLLEKRYSQPLFHYFPLLPSAFVSFILIIT